MRDDISQTFLDELSKQGCKPYQLAVFDFPDGSRRYLSDRVFQVQPGVASEALIESWGELSYAASTAESVAGNGVPIQTVTLSILNLGPNWFTASYLATGIIDTEVTLYQYAGADRVVIGTFIVQDNTQHAQGSLIVTVDLVSKLMANDPYIGTLDPATNEYFGIALGALSGVAGTLYGVNPYAKLAVALTPGDTTISTDRDLAAVGFTAPGQIEIGVDTVDYTGISGNDFTGCSGVDLEASTGQFVTLVGHDYVFAFGAGPVDAAGPVFIDGEVYNGDYVIDTASNPVTVTFPDRLPNKLTEFDAELVSGTLVTSSPDAIFSFGPGYFADSNVYVDGDPYPNSYSQGGTVSDRTVTFPGGLPYLDAVYSDPVNIEKKYKASDFSLYNGSYVHTFYLNGDRYRSIRNETGLSSGTIFAKLWYEGIDIPPGAVILFIKSDVRARFFLDNSDAYMYLAGDYLDIQATSSYTTFKRDITTPEQAKGNYVEFRADSGTYTEAELGFDDGNYFTIEVAYKTLVSEYQEFDACEAYITRPSERQSFDNPTLNIGDPAAGGVNPADAIQSLLSQNPSLITNTASFTTARNWFDTNSYEFTGFIPGNQRMRKTLLDMCRQSRSMLYSSAGGEIFLKVRGIDTGTPVQTYKSESDPGIYSVAKNSISVADQRAADIVNSLDVRYDASDVQAGYQSSFTAADSPSITRHKLQKDTFDMYLVSDTAMAQHVAAYDLSVRKALYTLVTFYTYTEAFPLEIGDVVALTTRYSGIIYFKGKIANIVREFGSWKQKKMDRSKITIAGYYQSVAQLDLADTQTMVDELEIKNLGQAGWGNTEWGDDGWGL